MLVNGRTAIDGLSARDNAGLGCSADVSGALDILTPPETGAALAALYGATYQLEPAHGHNVLLGEGARRIAEDVIAWVIGRLAR
jgi:hypothetical protein